MQIKSILKIGKSNKSSHSKVIKNEKSCLKVMRNDISEMIQIIEAREELIEANVKTSEEMTATISDWRINFISHIRGDRNSQNRKTPDIYSLPLINTSASKQKTIRRSSVSPYGSLSYAK